MAAEPLPQRVKEAREELTALIRDVDPDAASWVEQVRRARPRTPSVVVVGETNRGKSSLVNALLENPGLSPVNAEVATATYLLFQHNESWSAEACYAGEQSPVPFALSELPNWVSSLNTLPEGHVPPRYVRVSAPVDLLSRLVLVDTPGVGGLDSVHGELAMEAAASATALLFVVDASAPLTRGELDFLYNAGDRVETVIFALTKTDQYRGWRQVLEENRQLLAEHAPRFADAPMYPVSARLEELAANAPSEQAAAMLRERSEIAELRSSVQNLVAGRSAMLTEANTLRALSTVLTEMRAKLEADQRALTIGEDEAESLRKRRDELVAARRSSTRVWQVRLRGEVQRARVEVGHEVTRQVREVQNWFRREIDSADRKNLQVLPQQVDSALQLASSKIAEALSSKLASVTDNALSELFSADELEVIRAQFTRGTQAPVTLPTPEQRPSTAEDKLLLFMGVSGGLGAGRAATLPLAGLGVASLNPVVLPVTIVLGLGAGWWMARIRKHAADKQHMKQWLTEAIADARSALDQLTAEQLIEAEQQLSLSLDDAVSKRIDAIEAELREVDKALRMDAAERTRTLQGVQRKLSEAKAGRERVEQLLGEIRSLRDTV